MMFEGTIMPAFYINSGYNRSLEKFEGKSILTGQQVEDVVAYLLTLKES
jgi:sulfur-oxidizing protein SoxX